MKGHKDSVTTMCLDGLILMSGSDDHTIRLWNLFNWTPANFSGVLTHDAAIQDMIFIREAGLLLACSQDRQIRVWIYQRGELVDQFSKLEDIRCLEYVSEGEGVLLIGTDTDHGGVLTQSISQYTNFINIDLPRLANAEHYDEDYGEEQKQHEPYGDDYDVMEGKDINTEL